MTALSPATRTVALVAAATLTLAACGGDSTDASGLPTAEDLGAGGEQPVDPVEEPIAGDDREPVTSGMCAADEPDCQDTIDPTDGEVAAGGDAAGSCLAGDPDCTDESYGGQDVARPVPVSTEPSGAERIESGATAGATGRPLVGVHLIDDTTLELTFDGGACDLLEDVVITESTEEVRVLVLTGMDAGVDACTQQVVTWSTEVDLDSRLGDRQLLDLAG